MKNLKKLTKIVAASFVIVAGTSMSAPYTSLLSTTDSSVPSNNVSSDSFGSIQIPEISSKANPVSQRVDLINNSKISKSVSEISKISEISNISVKKDSSENSSVKKETPSMKPSVEKSSSKETQRTEKENPQSSSNKAKDNEDGYWVTTTTIETYYPPSSTESHSSQKSDQSKSSNLSLPKPSRKIHEVSQSPSPTASVSSNGFKIEDTIAGFLEDTEHVPCGGLYEYGRGYSNFYTREIGCDGSQIYLDLQPGEKISVNGIGYVMTGSQNLNYYRDGMDDVSFNGEDLYIQTCYPDSSGNVRIVKFKKI